MIGYLPELYPDELVYSWFSRYLVHSGHRLHSAVLRELFCKRSDNPSKEFLGHLNDEAKKVIQEVIPLRELILRHTMVPQYARFLPLNERFKALHRMEYDYCDPHHLFTILPRDERDVFLRYCPACIQEDRDIHGETFWHRKHQLRSMKLCHKHGCLLEQSTVPAKSEQCYTHCSAEEYAVISTPRYHDNPELLRYTQYISTIFDAPLDLKSDFPICAVLYSAMSTTEYMKSGGRARYTQKFTDDIRRYYKDIGLSDIVTINQIQKTLLMKHTEFTTVCQTAFFLGMTAEELLSPSLTSEQITAEQKAHYIRNRVPVDWEVFDAETAIILEPLARSIFDGSYRADGRPERVTERLIYRECKLQGHRLENMPKCRAILSRYYETYEQNWARKLVWAYNKLKNVCGDKPIYWVDLRKLSGVKERNLLKVLPLIHNYADDDTAIAIVDILKAIKGAAPASHT